MTDQPADDNSTANDVTTEVTPAAVDDPRLAGVIGHIAERTWGGVLALARSIHLPVETNVPLDMTGRMDDLRQLLAEMLLPLLGNISSDGRNIP